MKEMSSGYYSFLGMTVWRLVRIKRVREMVIKLIIYTLANRMLWVLGEVYTHREMSQMFAFKCVLAEKGHLLISSSCKDIRHFSVIRYLRENIYDISLHV